VQVSPYSPWLAAPERTRPLYRGSKAAELLLTNLAGIYSDAQSASNILARDPTLKQSTLDEFRKTIGPTIQRIVRAKAYDPVEAEKKLAQLNNLIASFAAPFDKLADKSLKAYDSETNKTRKNEQLSLALECAEGYKAVGGDPIEAARLLGTIYGEKQDWAFALQSFNEGLPRQQGSPSGFDLDKIQTRHFGLLLSRTYFILDHLDELTREQLTFPDGLIQPAAKAAELAAKDMALTSRKGEALGAAGWALHAAAEEWKRDPTKVPTVCSWRLRAFQYLKEALGSSLEATKKRYGWKWRTLIAIQVDELLDVPEARAKASDYVDTAITQLNTGIEELNDALKEVADGLKKDIPPEKRRELEAQRKELGDEKNDLETRIIRLKEKRPGPANSTGT